MEDQGKKITLNVTHPSDMSRDVLKSDTCSIAIPELDFEMGGMSVGGKFTTLEGLLTDILEQVEKNSLWGGDAAAPDVAERMKLFKSKFPGAPKIAAGIKVDGYNLQKVDNVGAL